MASEITMPCPECGSSQLAIGLWTQQRRHRVYCKCGRSVSRHSREYAISEWNRLANEYALPSPTDAPGHGEAGSEDKRQAAARPSGAGEEKTS